MKKLIGIELEAEHKGTLWVNPDAIVAIERITDDRSRLVLIGSDKEYNIGGNADDVAAYIAQLMTAAG